MKIVFFGSAEFGIPSLDAIAKGAHGHQLVHIFTQPAHRAGRGRKPRPTPVATWAQENSIPCTEAENINEPEMAQQVAECKGDLLVVIAFGQKISQQVIDFHPKGAINVHSSLLPKYRGAAPINFAILNNDSESGISIITLAQRMDAGEILGQSSTPISKDDDAKTLHDRLSQLSPELLIKTIDLIEDGTAVYQKQDESEVTPAHKIKKTDGYIHWEESAENIYNKIRGLWPWPGAQAQYISAKTGKCTRVIISKSSIVPTGGDDPGRCGLFDEDLNIICGKDRIKIERLKPAGGREMAFKDFANGRSVMPCDAFIPIDETE